MNRIKLKCGGKARKKAFFGADGALMAAATLASAGMQVAATTSSAKQQAKAMVDNANVQAQSIKQQSENNTKLQQDSINFTKTQNAESRKQQQDIQATLQMLAGQQTMNDRLEATKVKLKYGGRKTRTNSSPVEDMNNSSTFSYGGGSRPFEVTDGGQALPITTDNYGYGLYELFGNDHEHYHKTRGGKHKSGVGIKFANGGVVEGEGNQNTNRGELLYVTPNDAMFISKHSIKGFNPREAVMSGVHPQQAFAMQERIKDVYGIEDDGSKAKCGKRTSLKKSYGGYNILNDSANFNNDAVNFTLPIATGSAYVYNRNKLKCGGRKKAYLGQIVGLNPQADFYKTNAKYLANGLPPIGSTSPTTKSSFFNNYGGAIIGAGANLAGAGLGILGNYLAGRTLKNAYNESANIISNAYDNLSTIDENIISREDFQAPHTLAVVRSADTNVNPQLERIARNARYERNEVNRNTLSSAARQFRLAGINDRMVQRSSEQYAYKHNMDEQIKQQNAQSITQTAQANADRDVQARQDYTRSKLALMQYNNDIKNQRIMGKAQALADASSNIGSTIGQIQQANLNNLSTALASSIGGFATTFDGLRNERNNLKNLLIGQDTSNVVDYLTMDSNNSSNRAYAFNLYNQYKNSNNPNLRNYANQLKNAYNF